MNGGCVRVRIEAGVCGFVTEVCARPLEDGRVALDVESPCKNVGRFAFRLAEHGPVDPLSEIDPRADSAVFSAARPEICGCCLGCIVAPAVFKAMQVAAGLALPRDAVIVLENGRE